MTNKLINQDSFDLDLDPNTDNFVRRILHKSAVACGNIRSKNFDIETIKQENLEDLKALGVTNGLQMMLGAQMLAIHNLHKEIMVSANATSFPHEARYCANTAIKLSNTFVQQVTLLNKLQGGSNQKMTVEHVSVHKGGQAIVGNVQGVAKKSDEKK